jgi:hypothetical protein
LSKTSNIVSSGFKNLISTFFWLLEKGWQEGSMINYMLNKTPHKIIIVKHQFYIYVDGSYGTLKSTALNQVKARINDSILNVQISATAELWLDLNTIEDEAWKTAFLKYFGLT